MAEKLAKLLERSKGNLGKPRNNYIQSLVVVLTVSLIFASFSAILYFFDFLASAPELGPQNPSLGRKFYVESDFQVKNTQFQRPEAKT